MFLRDYFLQAYMLKHEYNDFMNNFNEEELNWLLACINMDPFDK